MKKRFLPVVIVLLLVMLFNTTCTHTEDGPIIISNAVTDVDGNSYDAVVIGEQVWMQTNLRTRHFRDGFPIPVGETYPEEYYGNYVTSPYAYDPSGTYFPNGYDSKRNGLQYNALALIDEHGLCPQGWHVPSNEEWTMLRMYADSRQKGHLEYSYALCAKALAAKTGWTPSPILYTPGHHPQTNNSTGFEAHPNGCIPHYSGEFVKVLYHYSDYKEDDIQMASFWGIHNAGGCYAFYSNSIISSDYDVTRISLGFYGYSYNDNRREFDSIDCLPVRCIKD